MLPSCIVYSAAKFISFKSCYCRVGPQSSEVFNIYCESYLWEVVLTIILQLEKIPINISVIIWLYLTCIILFCAPHMLRW